MPGIDLEDTGMEKRTTDLSSLSSLRPPRARLQAEQLC